MRHKPTESPAAEASTRSLAGWRSRAGDPRVTLRGLDFDGRGGVGAIFDCVRRVTGPRTDEDVQGGLSEEDKRRNALTLAFAGREDLFDAFCREIREVVPPATTVVLRGSAVTARRWRDGAAFDADGPGTSDLDLTLVGDGALQFFKATGFFVPGVHSRPLSDAEPDIAPDLVPLRRRLMDMVKRPVNIQASRDIVLHFRGDLLGQPYLVLLEKPDGLSLSQAGAP